MSEITNISERIGPLSAKLINSDTFNFYRFFYRRGNTDTVTYNGETYSINMDNIVMKQINLHDNDFYSYHQLHDYLISIDTNVDTNITQENISNLSFDITNNFVNGQYSCLEVILPIKENNQYSDNDIERIYNTILDAIY